MREFFSNTILFLVGDKGSNDSERYFMNVISIVATFLPLLMAFSQILMGLEGNIVIIAFASSILCFISYLLNRFTNYLLFAKVLLTIQSVILIDFIWYFREMSNGPLTMFMLIFGALILWVWKGRGLRVLLVLYFGNILLMFVGEYYLLERISVYASEESRLQDIYISLFLYSILLIYILSVVKKEFQQQRDMAKHSDKLKSAFLANMSHEIRTPMNAIVGFSDLLDEDIDDEERRKYIKLIQNSSSNLLKLINEIIDLSKIEAGDVSLKNVKFNVKALFDELQEVYSLDIQHRGHEEVSIDLDMSDKTSELYCDQLRIRQIISNLISNAVKFTLKGKITLGFYLEANQAVFYVRDTGIGIPLVNQEQIFKRFTSFNYGNLNLEGTGIGLSIAQRTVELLKGKLWFESIEGKGSTFFFSVPCPYDKEHKLKSEAS